MPFLLLYIGDRRKFDDEAVLDSLHRLRGARLLEPGNDCLLTCSYKNGDDMIIIQLKTDRETIIIDGSGRAALAAALHLQTNYPEAIHLIDENYSFDLVLQGIKSVNELEQKIIAAGG